jgi:hypothetical protein
MSFASPSRAAAAAAVVVASAAAASAAAALSSVQPPSLDSMPVSGGVVAGARMDLSDDSITELDQLIDEASQLKENFEGTGSKESSIEIRRS